MSKTNVYFTCLSASGENQHEGHTRKQCFVTTQAEFFKRMTNPSLQIIDWHILSSDMTMLEFEYKEEFTPEKMTTLFWHRSQQPMPTYASMMFSIVQVSLYCILTQTPLSTSHQPVKTWFQLVIFWGTWPSLFRLVQKNYSYRLNNGECYCKIKGFSLIHTASKKLNFYTMKEEVFLWSQSGRSTNTVVTYPSRIKGTF